MAPTPPLRTQMTGRTPVIPSRAGRAPQTSAFPLLPAVAATLLLLGVGQVALWWWGGRMPEIPTYTRLAATLSGNTAEPSRAQAVRRNTPQQRLEAPPLEQNIQFGDAMGRVRVTFFTDPACGPCRAKIDQLAANLPVKGVRQVYKYWPYQPRQTTSGVLLELARREAVLPTFWKLLQAEGDRDISDMEMLQLLEQAGLPLSEQRTALSQNSAELYAALVPDLALARNAELPPPPVVVVDNQILDIRQLTAENLAKAVQKKLDGLQLDRDNQLWMMEQ